MKQIAKLSFLRLSLAYIKIRNLSRGGTQMQQDITLERLVYTVDEAAKLLGISRPTAFAGVRKGTIPSIRVGRRWLVPKAALDKKLVEAGQPKEG